MPFELPPLFNTVTFLLTEDVLTRCSFIFSILSHDTIDQLLISHVHYTNNKLNCFIDIRMHLRCDIQTIGNRRYARFFFFSTSQVHSVLTLAKYAIWMRSLPGCGSKRESSTGVGGTESARSKVKARHCSIADRKHTFINDCRLGPQLTCLLRTPSIPANTLTVLSSAKCQRAQRILAKRRLYGIIQPAGKLKLVPLTPAHAFRLFLNV